MTVLDKIEQEISFRNDSCESKNFTSLQTLISEVTNILTRGRKHISHCDSCGLFGPGSRLFTRAFSCILDLCGHSLVVIRIKARESINKILITFKDFSTQSMRQELFGCLIKYPMVNDRTLCVAFSRLACLIDNPYEWAASMSAAAMCDCVLTICSATESENILQCLADDNLHKILSPLSNYIEKSTSESMIDCLVDKAVRFDDETRSRNCAEIVIVCITNSRSMIDCIAYTWGLLKMKEQLKFAHWKIIIYIFDIVQRENIDLYHNERFNIKHLNEVSATCWKVLENILDQSKSSICTILELIGRLYNFGVQFDNTSTAGILSNIVRNDVYRRLALPLIGMFAKGTKSRDFAEYQTGDDILGRIDLSRTIIMNDTNHLREELNFVEECLHNTNPAIARYSIQTLKSLTGFLLTKGSFEAFIEIVKTSLSMHPNHWTVKCALIDFWSDLDFRMLALLLRNSNGYFIFLQNNIILRLLNMACCDDQRIHDMAVLSISKSISKQAYRGFKFEDACNTCLSELSCAKYHNFCDWSKCRCLKQMINRTIQWTFEFDSFEVDKVHHVSL
ncbi:hypothetical protein ACOME3_009190 [Neoechinorhynchus agilis]